MFNRSNNLKGYRLIVAVVLVPFLVSACVSKSRYEQAQSDLAETQSQVQRLSDEKLDLQSKFEMLQSDYEDLQSRNDTLQNEVDTHHKTIETLNMELKKYQDVADTAQSEVGSLLAEVAEVSCQSEAFQASLNDAKHYLDILDHFYDLNAFEDVEDVSEEWAAAWFADLMILVGKAGDPDLETKLEHIIFEDADSPTFDLDSYILHKVRAILDADISCPEPAG